LCSTTTPSTTTGQNIWNKFDTAPLANNVANWSQYDVNANNIDFQPQNDYLGFAERVICLPSSSSNVNFGDRICDGNNVRFCNLKANCIKSTSTGWAALPKTREIGSSTAFTVTQYLATASQSYKFYALNIGMRYSAGDLIL